MGIFKGAIARRLILSVLVLTVLAIVMAVGSVFLVQFIDRTLSRVAASADAAALSARIRSESLTMTDLARRYTLLGPDERPAVRMALFDQELLLSNLIAEAYRPTISAADEAEFQRVDHVNLKLHAFFAQARRVVSAYDSERSVGPATVHELRVLVEERQDPLVEAIRDFEQFELERAAQARAQARRVIQTIVAVLVVVAVVVLAASLSAVQQIVMRIIGPLALLRAGVEEFRLGRLDQPVQISGRDEVGGLASAFNTMAAELSQSRHQLEGYAHTLEQRVAERTAELEQANLALSQRAVQLETSSQVGRQATSILDLDELLGQAVDLIQERFGYYFVSVWLLPDHRDFVVLRAGAGHAGQSTRNQGLQISMDIASIVISVCKTGQGRLVNDVSEAPDYVAMEGLPDTCSELALPLRMGEHVIGVLDIQSDQLAAFSSDDWMVLQTLADQIAIAIRNAQLYQVEQTRRTLAEALAQAGRELSSNLDLRQVTELILKQLETVVSYGRGLVMLQQGDVVRSVAQRGFPADRQPGEWSVPLRQGGVFGQIVESRQPLLVADVTQETGWQQLEWLPLHRSWLGVPLISKDRVIGMISLTRQAAGAFTQDDATLVSAFAGQAVVALENASLYDEIRQFNEQLEQMVQQRTEELNQAYYTLERLDKTKSNFIEVAAHELRTPLTVIRGYTQVLASKPALQNDRDNRQLLSGVVGGVDRLHEIVNSMLDVTKIDSQTLRMRKERAALLDIVGSVHTDLRQALEERQIALTMVGLDSLPVVTVDPDLLYKVFCHLVVNAIKFTPDGGSVTISGRVVEPREGSKPLPACVEVVVSDTGIGIDPAHHELIFEKFYQTGEVAVHSSGRTKFKGGGPGLGLAIARGIVQAHGGRIWVESEGCDEQRCPGSHFHIVLPASDVAVRDPAM